MNASIIKVLCAIIAFVPAWACGFSNATVYYGPYGHVVMFDESGIHEIFLRLKNNLSINSVEIVLSGKVLDVKRMSEEDEVVANLRDVGGQKWGFGYSSKEKFDPNVSRFLLVNFYEIYFDVNTNDIVAVAMKPKARPLFGEEFNSKVIVNKENIVEQDLESILRLLGKPLRTKRIWNK